MQLGLLVLVVLTITVSEEAPSVPIANAWQSGMIAAFGLIVPSLIAWIGTRFLRRKLDRAQCTPADAGRQFDLLRRLHAVAWAVGVTGTVLLGHWPRLVRYTWHFDHWILLRDLLVTAPIFLPLLLAWTAFFHLDIALQQGPAAASEHDRPGRPLGIISREQLRYVLLYARHHFSLCLLPVLLLLACHDTAVRLWPSWQQRSVGFLYYAVPLALLIVVFPQILCLMWRTERLAAGPRRRRIMALAQRLGVRCRDIRVWRTEHQVLNAAVAGLFARLRYLFVSDGLLALCRDDELEAVVIHEFGHVRRHHLALRLLLLSLPLWIVGWLHLAFPRWSATVSASCDHWIATHPLAIAALPLAGLAYAVLALGWYSRLLEHDADLCVVTAGRAQAFIITLDRLAFLTGDRGHRRGWLHPSTDCRIELLQRASASEQVLRRFRRRVQWANIALGMGWCLPGLLGLGFLLFP